MYRPDKILTAFTGGVGFRSPTLSGLPTLNDDNKKTRSGMVFQDASFLVTIKNIYECQEDTAITDDNFNALLLNMQKDAILEVVNKVVEEKSSLVQSSNIFPYEKPFKDTLEPSGKAVGFRIWPPAINGYSLQIPWIETSFDSAKNFKVYLYNSNLPGTPIKEAEVTTVAGQSVVTVLDGWYIADDAAYKGGYFYLVYKEDDLDGAKAYAKNYSLSKFQLETEYYYIRPVSLTVDGDVIDVTSYKLEPDTFGLNIGVNVAIDHTETLVRAQDMFWTAIKYQMAEKVMFLIKHSTRHNATVRQAQDIVKLIDLQLFGNEKYQIAGIQKKLHEAVETVREALFYQPRISRGTLH